MPKQKTTPLRFMLRSLTSGVRRRLLKNCKRCNSPEFTSAMEDGGGIYNHYKKDDPFGLSYRCKAEGTQRVLDGMEFIWNAVWFFFHLVLAAIFLIIAAGLIILLFGGSIG